LIFAKDLADPFIRGVFATELFAKGDLGWLKLQLALALPTRVTCARVNGVSRT
jgi:hypothetical protein